MPDQPVDIVHELLCQIRAEQTAARTDIERRFDRLESDVVEIKRTLRGLTYMMATFTGRLEGLEVRVDRLESK